MAAKKEEVLPDLEKVVQELKANLKKIEADLKYFEFIDEKNLTPEYKEEISRLEYEKDDVEQKMMLILMALQNPIYNRIANLTEVEKAALVTEEYKRLKNLKEKKLGESMAIVLPPIPSKPVDFLDWSDDKQREFVESSEKTRNKSKEEADGKKAKLEEEARDIEKEMQALLTEKGAKSCVDKYLESKGFVLKGFTKDEMQGVFGSLEFLPNGISLRIAQYLSHNPYIAQEIIKSYRDLKMASIESPGLDLEETVWYLRKIIPMKDDKSKDKEYVAEILGIKPAHSYKEIKERYSGKDTNIAKLTARKEEALREFTEVRAFIKSTQLKRDIPDFRSSDFLTDDPNKKQTKTAEFLALIAEAKSKTSFTQETLGVTNLGPNKTFKDGKEPGFEVLEARFLDLQKRYEKVSKRQFLESDDHREDRLEPLDKEMEEILKDFRNQYYYLYDVMFERVFKPKIAELELAKAAQVLETRGYSGDSPGLYSTIYTDGAVGEEYYKKYVASINSSFDWTVTSIKKAYDDDMKKAQEDYDSKLLPIEDSILERLEPVIGKASREQVIEVGLRSINGVWKSVYERSMPTEQLKVGESPIMPKVIVSAEDIELAKRRTALAGFYSEKSALADEIIRYADGTVVAKDPDETPKVR